MAEMEHRIRGLSGTICTVAYFTSCTHQMLDTSHACAWLSAAVDWDCWLNLKSSKQLTKCVSASPNPHFDTVGH